MYAVTKIQEVIDGGRKEKEMRASSLQLHGHWS